MASVLPAAVVMGLLLLAVALAIDRGIDWRSHSIVPRWSGGEREGTAVRAVLGHPATWTVSFVLVALGATALAVVAVGGFGVSLPEGTAVALAAAPLLLVVAFYLIGGTYVAARERNLSAAGATLTTALLAGVLLVIGVSAQLLMG